MGSSVPETGVSKYFPQYLGTLVPEADIYGMD